MSEPLTAQTIERRSRDVATVKLYMKVRDQFCGSVVDAAGAVVWEQDDGYVPSWMPGQHFGDYVILDIDIATGRVTNWREPTEIARLLQEQIDGGDK